MIELGIGRIELAISLILLEIGSIELGIGLVKLRMLSDRARNRSDRARDRSDSARDRVRSVELGITRRTDNARRTVLAHVSGLVLVSQGLIKERFDKFFFSFLSHSSSERFFCLSQILQGVIFQL